MPSHVVSSLGPACPVGGCVSATTQEGVIDFTRKLLDTSDFPARWGCGNWSPGLGWLHIVSDLLIFGAYLSIPIGLAYFLVRRRDLPFPGLIALFVAFILSCGIGHAIEALIFWHPVYRLAGVVKGVTAVVSWMTVVSLVRVMPEALKLPDIARLNQQLRREMDERMSIESEARKLALVAARTDNAVIITDAHGRIEWVNAGFTRITEYALEEVIGRTPGKLLQGPETDPDTIVFMRDRLGAGEGFKTELINYTRSGRAYWLAIEVQPMCDDTGKLTHFMAIETDITERKRAEQALTARTRQAALGADVGLALTQDAALPDQVQACARALVRHLDAAFARIWAIVPGEDVLELIASAGLYTHLDGEHARIAVGTKKIGKIAEACQPTLTNDVAHDPLISDQEWARREGLVAFAGHPLMVNGRLVGVAAVFARRPFDAATIEALGSVANAMALGIERERQSQALRASEARKAAILQTALDAIILMDDAGRILEFNPAAETTFGFSASEAVGRPMEEIIIPPALRVAHRNGLKRYGEVRESSVLGRRLELSAVRRDGTEFPVELAITPILTGDRPVFTGYIRDITERKEHEESLRRARDRAEEASRAKSRFLANMSHEIRTPLTAVLGFADVLNRGIADEAERRDYLGTIVTSGRHLLTLLDDVLDLSKIEAGRMTYRRVRCSPHRVLSEALSILRVRACEKGLSLDLRWKGLVPDSIQTDPDRLRQLLMNLVGNAIKFTERGGVRLEAEIASGQPGPFLKLAVHDTGIGIAPEHLERVFSPFDQADDSVTRRFGGTGLGLAISRHIAPGSAAT